MKQFLKVYQIYFDPSQLPRLEREYIPYDNSTKCTIFFENSVIRELIEERQHLDADYFGVVSWKLREKIDFLRRAGRRHPHIANRSIQQFEPLLFENELRRHQPDVMSFQRHMPHDPIVLADRYHPNFIKYYQEIFSKIGIRWVPTHLEDVFYCNNFAARSQVYEKYVREMLIPAIDVMQNMPELMENSHYPNPLPGALQAKFGIGYYPYHTFLCERMFSYFARIHNLKCLHY